MAEQTSHNVVNNPESTSGSPLVDAAASQTSVHSAASGTNPSTTTATDSNSSGLPDSSQPTKDHATSANATMVALAGSGAATDAAEPSAGDAAIKAAQVSAVSSEKPGPAHGDLANGVHDEGDSHADDRSTADVSVEMSVNSDTDNSRADAAEKERPHHARTNSVKKPTAFSKVTATKSFMSKIAPTAPSAAKVGEKPSPAATPSLLTSKPRLVAKTGAQSMLKPRVAGDGPSGPDASKVWNKNRPVQPAPPRQFTDEELKQQYGIHLATRLQSDENGKDSKWADIDDDEEDWAPETVVWMDGTKSSLTATDPTPPPAQKQKEQKPAQPQQPQQQQKPADGVKPTLTVKRSDRPGQAMQILKPGVAASQAKQNGPSASPSPGPDKRSLTAKSPAPAPPAKSPWAPVPKPDAVSPINIPVQQPPPRQPLPSQDARATEPIQPIPAREIAADTFDRSWREGEGGQRELFNSTNGRYEPVPERRGSMREPVSRKPAVLQRPTQSGTSPAEPSPAFQSRTSAQMDGSWGRRRGSSVSQGSLPPNRRMSMNSRTELAGTPEVPPNDARSPTAARNEASRPPFAQQSAWDQQMPVRPNESQDTTAVEDAATGEDPVKAQERIMREKRELAKKRRQEEEAAEEEAKRERLKAKLAALENAGKSKKERDAEAAAAAASNKETAAVEKSTEPSSAGTAPHPEPAKPATASAATASALESQTLPSPAEQALPPRSEKLPSPLPPKPQPAGLPDRALASSEQQPKQAPIGTRPFQQGPAPYQPPNSSYSSPGERKPQPFGRSPLANNDKFSPWPTSGSGGNVWGTSGIGNGTFDIAPMPMSQTSSSLPPPPGMARGNNSARISPQAYGPETRSPNMGTHQAAEQQRAFPPPGIDSRPDSFPSQSRLNGVSPAPGAGRPGPSHPPGPIGPPSRTQQAQANQASHQDPIAAWNSAATRLPQQYNADIQAAQERRAREPLPPPQQAEHRFKETFKKTSADQGRLGAPRRYDATEYTIHDGQGSRSVSTLSPAPPAPPATQTQPQAPLPPMSPAQDKWAIASNVTNPVRIPDGSQNPAHGGMPRQAPIGTQPVTAYQAQVNLPPAPIAPTIESKEQSPPPPDTESHPVNEGDAHRPLVRLPKLYKVKLPPVSPQTQAAQLPSQQNGSVMMPQRPYSGYAPPGVARPIVMNQAWQDRFNGLFNRATVQTEAPPSPPKTPPKVHRPALAVAAASRAPMDTQASGATVSLPHTQKAKSPYGFTVDNSNEITTKPSIDEMFNEELSFGSMPKVRVPRNLQYNVQPYGPNTKNMLMLGPNSRVQKAIESKSVDKDPFFWKNPQGIFVKIPFTRLNNKLCRHPESQQGQATPETADRKTSYPSKSHHDRPNHQHEDRRPSGRFNKAREHDNAYDKPRDKTHEKVKNGKSNSAPETPRTATPAKDPQPEPRKPSLAQIDRAVKEATGMSDGGPRPRKNFKPRGGARNPSGNASSNANQSGAAAAPVKSN